MCNATSSPASEDGAWLYVSPDGPTTDLSGPDRAHANLSARQALEKGLLTTDIYGLSGGGSSGSADLQSSLESRLRARLDVHGSIEYVLKWKHWAMSLGPPICALRASVRRISGNASSGWATPVAREAGGTPEQFLERKRRAVAKGAKMGVCLTSLSLQAQTAGWATPTQRDHKSGNTDMTKSLYRKDGKMRNDLLDYQAALAGRPTPTHADTTGAGHAAQGGKNLRTVATEAHGASTNGSSVRTESRGALSPELPRWLMGYPVAWAWCGALATLSCRK